MSAAEESTNAKAKPPKVDLGAAIKEKLAAVASTATADELALVKQIIETAKSGKRSVEMFNFTPAVCAIMFLTENGHNRDWIPELTEEYARRMNVRLWKPNNAALGFYVDGHIADGQHRMSAAALAGFTLADYVVVFGMARGDIDSVDCPKGRDGASHAKLDGIQETSTKQVIVRAAAAYMVRAGEPEQALRSAAEVKIAVEANNVLLDACIRMGAESHKNSAAPILKANQASTLAYLMLKATPSWPELRVREKLALFQTGASQDGPDSVSFVAAKYISDCQDKSRNRERLTGVKELAAAMYAFLQAERNPKAAARKADVKAAVSGKTVPNPGYPDNLPPIAPTAPAPASSAPAPSQVAA